MKRLLSILLTMALLLALTACDNGGGDIKFSFYGYIVYDGYGVRPALWLNL
ncbi:MAG: hypothetical protein FWG70_00210 [Oscillospiraceae bacterium]|nr:hypothetical protein [Oscillospiraceae bacterium]